jgi:hypothetical protein
LRAGASLFTSNVTIQGNVGLGTSILTGSAGHAFMPASGVLTSVGTSANFGNNVRYTTGWIANSTAASGLYSITGGQHDWYTAASVTAGSAVTLVKTLTLDTSGNLTATANVTAYSDERLKKDWEELPSDFIERLAQVKHGTYTRTDTGARQIGVGAQSLQPVAPEGVLDGEHLSVAYGNVALAAAVELAKRVVRLEAALRQLIGD